MASNRHLTASLEEFGLSAYEARAYIALITRGTMSAGDLSFYSEIPRAKIYPTMKKLTGKNLAITSRGKSAMTCTAVRPEDAFDGIIHGQIQKVTAMNALVEDLKEAGEKSRRASDSEEKRYTQVGAASALGQMRSMIAGAKSAVAMTTDMWGLRLLAQCREQLIDAAKRGVEARCIIPYDQICSDAHRTLPGFVSTRASRTAFNCIILDMSDVMILDSTDGRGAVFASSQMLGMAQSSAFEMSWDNAMRTDGLAKMTAQEAQEICAIIDAMNKRGLLYALGEAAGQTADNAAIPDMYGMLERDGATLEKRPLYDTVCMFDAIMRITCNGGVCLEQGGMSITIEAPRGVGDAAMPWILVLEGLLRRRGYCTRTVRGIDARGHTGADAGVERTRIHLGA